MDELVAALPAGQAQCVRRGHRVLALTAASRLPEEAGAAAALEALLQDVTPVPAALCLDILSALAARRSPSERLQAAVFSLAARCLLSCSPAESLRLVVCMAQSGPSPAHLQQLLQACCQKLAAAGGSGGLGPEEHTLRRWLASHAWKRGDTLCHEQQAALGGALLALALELLRAGGLPAELAQAARLEAALAQRRPAAASLMAEGRVGSACQGGQLSSPQLLAGVEADMELEPCSEVEEAAAAEAAAMPQRSNSEGAQGGQEPTAAEAAQNPQAVPEEQQQEEAAPPAASPLGPVPQPGSLGEQGSFSPHGTPAGQQPPAAEAVSPTPSAVLAASSRASPMPPSPQAAAASPPSPAAPAFALHRAATLDRGTCSPVQQAHPMQQRQDQAGLNLSGAFHVSNNSQSSGDDSGPDSGGGGGQGATWLDAIAVAQKRCEDRQAAAAPRRQAAMQRKAGGLGAPGEEESLLLGTDGAEELEVGE